MARNFTIRSSKKWRLRREWNPFFSDKFSYEILYKWVHQGFWLPCLRTTFGWNQSIKCSIRPLLSSSHHLKSLVIVFLTVKLSKHVYGRKSDPNKIKRSHQRNVRHELKGNKWLLQTQRCWLNPFDIVSFIPIISLWSGDSKNHLISCCQVYLMSRGKQLHSMTSWISVSQVNRVNKPLETETTRDTYLFS